MNSTPMSAENFNSAKQELAKLPLLGPVAWLFSRDSRLRYTFMADVDWRLLPPLVLDQCRVYSRQDVPWAYSSWALVNDAVNERLRSNAPLIAPHEWKSGPHPWLIDVVAPFGDALAIAKETAAVFAPKQTVHVWLPSADGSMSLKALDPGANGG
jgi:cytolysin-activating lysine-acyltransferase